MTARAYSSPAPADENFVFPTEEPTVKIKVHCRCGVRSVTNLRLSVAALPALRSGSAEPDLIAGSSWCRDCKTLVKVTARALHLA